MTDMTLPDWHFAVMAAGEPADEEELVELLKQERNRSHPMNDIRQGLRKGWIAGEDRDFTRVYWLAADEESPSSIPDSLDLTVDDESFGGSRYREYYEEACSRAGREIWEPVGEEYLREVLAEDGMEHIIAAGELEEIGWKRYDLSDFDGREDESGWYYPSGDEPRVDEFRRFHELLTAEAPDGYEPYYFRVEKAGKAPAVEYGSWKSEENRLTFEEAVEWMREGGNVGLAGTPDDALVNVDIDDDEETTPDDLKDTLRARSRSRSGFHAWYFEEGEEPIPNIPTDTAGEIRTDWQYVVAAGSFVCSASEEIPDDADSPGYYTVEEETPVSRLTYDDLPAVFREFHAEIEQQEKSDEETDPQPDESADEEQVTEEGVPNSAVYEITAEDVVQKEGDSTDSTKRWSSMFHDSSTDANMSISEQGRIQCWRHNVAHGGLQALAVLSGEYGGGDSACRAIGSPHKNSGAGRNVLKDDWRLSWYAWLHAKRNGYIPSDDPVPFVAMEGLARDEYGFLHEDYDMDKGRSLIPAGAYNAVLHAIEQDYGVDPGREEVGSEKEQTEGKAKARKESTDDEKEEIVMGLVEEQMGE